MEQQLHPLLGRKVEYTITANATVRGTILDRISMFDLRKPTDNATNKQNFIVSGFLIENEGTGEIESVAYWRIKQRVNG